MRHLSHMIVDWVNNPSGHFSYGCGDSRNLHEAVTWLPTRSGLGEKKCCRYSAQGMDGTALRLLEDIKGPFWFLPGAQSYIIGKGTVAVEC